VSNSTDKQINRQTRKRDPFLRRRW